MNMTMTGGTQRYPVAHVVTTFGMGGPCLDVVSIDPSDGRAMPATSSVSLEDQSLPASIFGSGHVSQSFGWFSGATPVRMVGATSEDLGARSARSRAIAPAASADLRWSGLERSAAPFASAIDSVPELVRWATGMTRPSRVSGLPADDVSGCVVGASTGLGTEAFVQSCVAGSQTIDGAAVLTSQVHQSDARRHARIIADARHRWREYAIDKPQGKARPFGFTKPGAT